MWGAHTPPPLPPLEGSDPSLVHLLPEYTPSLRTQKSQWKCELLSPTRECFQKTDLGTLYHDDNVNSIMDYSNFWLEPPWRVCCFSPLGQGEIQGKAGGAAAAKQLVMFWTSLDSLEENSTVPISWICSLIDLIPTTFPLAIFPSPLYSYSSSAAHNTTIPRLSSPLSSQPPPSLSPQPLHTSPFPNSHHPCCPLQKQCIE